MIDNSIRLTTVGGEGETDTNESKMGSGLNSAGSGTLIGTYEYMAPEQQDKQEATVQSDIYSLGLIIYRMLIGVKAKDDLNFLRKWIFRILG